MFALVDCNNFYVSCEKVFNPCLKNRPVVVLSNNDGCVISRSNEAKHIGIKMGAPVFKCQNLVKKYDVKVYSANFVLYGDMSGRVMNALSAFARELEIYSIDEAFLSLNGVNHPDLSGLTRIIQRDVRKKTGIPVSIGVAPTKTLAKIANHYAKDHPETRGVYHLLNPREIETRLRETPVEDVWGIGRGKAVFLRRHGIETALDLSRASDTWIRKNLTIVSLRTVWELRGTSCLALEDVRPARKAIGTSRTFGYEVESLDEMEEAVCAYVAKAAVKLRRQNSLAGFLQVCVETNPFRKGRFYRNAAASDITPPTADTPRLMETARRLLKAVYRDGFKYKSCGVLLMNLSSGDAVQEDLFRPVYQNTKRKRLMEIVDQHNARANSGKLFWVAEGLGKPWFMKQARKSRRFTTRWDELLEVNADAGSRPEGDL